MYVISSHMKWITCLIVSSFWEGSRSLMKVRDGSSESASKPFFHYRHAGIELVPTVTEVAKVTTGYSIVSASCVEVTCHL